MGDRHGLPFFHGGTYMVDKKAIQRYHIRRDGRLRRRGFRFDVEWEENKHPRGKDGRFTSGGGSSNIKIEGPKASKKYISGYLKKHPEIKEEIPKYKGVLAKVRDFEKDNPGLEDGTYDALTGKPKEINSGFCVTFHQNLGIGNEFGGYDDDDYAAMCAISIKELGADGVNIGYFGNPEVSFVCRDGEKAREFARAHNQQSVYDAETGRIWVNEDWDEEKNPIKGKGNN